MQKDDKQNKKNMIQEEYKSELELICKSQGFSVITNEKGDYSDDFVRNLWKAIIWQRPLKSQKGNIGKEI